MRGTTRGGDALNTAYGARDLDALGKDLRHVRFIGVAAAAASLRSRAAWRRSMGFAFTTSNPFPATSPERRPPTLYSSVRSWRWTWMRGGSTARQRSCVTRFTGSTVRPSTLLSRMPRAPKNDADPFRGLLAVASAGSAALASPPPGSVAPRNARVPKSGVRQPGNYVGHTSQDRRPCSGVGEPARPWSPFQ
jgi:hypothetical protein